MAAGRTRESVEKSAGDYVTAVDGASERAIAGFLSEATPDIPLVGEERGGHHVRPLLAGRPAGRHHELPPRLPGRRRLGRAGGTGTADRGGRRGPVPSRDVCGSRRAPAPRSNERTGPSSRSTWLGAPPNEPSSARASRSGTRTCCPRYYRALYAALERFEDLRRPGAAALDLAWVAAGVFDGFFELALGPWDVAAGAVLIREAGGIVTDWAGADDVLSGDILAGPPAVHAELLRIAPRHDTLLRRSERGPTTSTSGTPPTSPPWSAPTRSRTSPSTSSTTDPEPHGPAAPMSSSPNSGSPSTPTTSAASCTSSPTPSCGPPRTTRPRSGSSKASPTTSATSSATTPPGRRRTSSPARPRPATKRRHTSSNTWNGRTRAR